MMQVRIQVCNRENLCGLVGPSVDQVIDQYHHHNHRQGFNVTTDTKTGSVVPASSGTYCICTSTAGKPTEAVKKLGSGSAVSKRCCRPSTCTIVPRPWSVALVELKWGALLRLRSELCPATERTSSEQRAQDKCRAPPFSAIQSAIEQKQCSDGRGDWSDWHGVRSIFSGCPCLQL